MQNSIKEFGFLSPCIIDKNFNVIAGHGRIMAAKNLKMQKIPCVFAENLTDQQRRAYIIADNKLTELAAWDNDKLKIELQELTELNFDISLTGFDDKDFDFKIDLGFDENNAEAVAH